MEICACGRFNADRDRLRRAGQLDGAGIRRITVRDHLDAHVRTLRDHVDERLAVRAGLDLQVALVLAVQRRVEDHRGIFQDLAVRVLHHQYLQMAGLRRRLVLAPMALTLRGRARNNETQKHSGNKNDGA